MKNAGLALIAIFALLMIGLAAAEYMEEDEPVDIEIGGSQSWNQTFIFNSSQSVSGVGIASAYRNLSAYPQALRSHISGSGAYSYDSTILVRKDVESGTNPEDFQSSDRIIDLQENVSAANAATTLNIPGSFKVAPIKSLWRDAVSAGNRQGAALTAIFEEARSLNKEIAVKTSGKERFDYLVQSSEVSSSTGYKNIAGSFDASMDLNAAFNGTARLGMIIADADEKALPRVLQPSRRDSRTMIDEFYRGSFSLKKKMQISIKAKYIQDEDDWLPCCFGGYLTEPTYYQKGPKGFGSNLTNIFDCTCFKPISSDGCSK